MIYKNAKQALADPRLLKAAAKKLATDGVHGDTILAHIGPQEAALLKARGGVGTINPRSGLPQFYDMGTDGSNLGGGQGDTATTGGDGSYGGANNGTAAAAASALGPGFMDKIGNALSGYFGQNKAPDADTLGPNPMSAQPAKDTYGGILGSNAALSAASLAGTALAGPYGGYAASTLAGLAQGRGLAASAGTLGGVVQGAIDHGVSAPASAQSQTTATDAAVTPQADPTAAFLASMGPQGQQLAQDPTRTLAMLRASMAGQS